MRNGGWDMILNDCVDVKKLQELQDAFSDFAGLEAVVVDAEGSSLILWIKRQRVPPGC